MTALATVHLRSVETLCSGTSAFSKTGKQSSAGALRQLTFNTRLKLTRAHAVPETRNGQQYRRYVETQMGAADGFRGS
jgi:hypothetical protein